MKKIIILIPALLLLAGCSDFLLRTPKDKLSPETFFRTDRECELYTNEFYTLFPSDVYSESADVIIKDVLSDEVAGIRTVPASSGSWNWDKLRDINFFLEHSHQCEDAEVRARYEGLARFFRAYFYFEKVKRYGDVPWLDHTLDSDSPELYKGRDDRKLVMANVLDDIDFAIDNLSSAQSDYRVTKWTALALKARIFLFEGTFRKYHSLGDWESCLEEAAKAANEFILTSPYSIYMSGATPYQDLFSSLRTNSTEIVLSRAFNVSWGLTHNVNNYFTATTMGRSGMLKDIVNMYLMKDGTPFTTKYPDHDSMSLIEETRNRDARLAQTIRTPGYTRIGESVPVAPDMSATMTGYQIIKYVGDVKYDTYNGSENDFPLFRAAEVYLAFAEAKAELGTLTQDDLDRSVNRLRARAGVASLNMQKANASPDPYLMSAETGYANVSGENAGVILEIRRERTVELICEGHRYWDIMRWKEGQRFTRPFIGMYFPGTGTYDLDGNGSVDFCIWTGSAPADQSGVVSVNLTSLNLSDGTRGNIVRHTTNKRVWDEDRDYLYPIPTDDIELTSGAIRQNPEWEDGLDY